MIFHLATQEQENIRSTIPRFYWIFSFSLLILTLAINWSTQKTNVTDNPSFVSLSFPGCTLNFHGKNYVPPNIIKVDVDFDNRYFWDDQEVSLNQLRDRLASVSKDPAGIEIHFDANPLADFGHVFAALSSIQKVSINALALVQRSPDR